MKDSFLKDVKLDLLAAFSETLENKMEQLKTFENYIMKLDQGILKDF